MHFTIGDEVAGDAAPNKQGRIVDGPNGGLYKVKWTEDGTEDWVDTSNLILAKADFGWRTIGGFLADLALLKFEYKFSDVVFSMGSSRTQFLPYQFKPVLQFIQQQPRGLMIADEVGLGKTIEAALILRELIARGSVSRILVICPANLREKWQRELRERFGLDLREMRARDFVDLKERYERDGFWPPFRGITSLEGLRATNFEETLVDTGIHLDLVIVDEAHHMRNPSTKSFGLGQALADQADHILLLSATPVQTGEGDLLSLLRLVDSAEFEQASAQELNARLEPNRHINAATRLLSAPRPDLARVADEMRQALGTYHGSAFKDDAVYMDWLRRTEGVHSLTPEATVRLRRDLQNVHTLAPYYTRTRKREVQDIAQRVARTMAVQLTPEEREFYDAWNTFIRTEALLRDVHPAFYVVQPERQAASSIHAVRERVEERIASGLRKQWKAADDDEYEGSDSEPHEDWQPGHNSFTTGQPATLIEVAAERLREAVANLPETDSKIERFIEVVKELLDDKESRKIICFTEWRGTLRHLLARLNREGISCTSISGDIDPRERAKRIDEFRRSASRRVLLSTEVGSEGLDFQFCDAIVNFDLPWNPMRVEQRIGRIDRFGQEEAQIVVVSLFVEDTIDTRVLRRLYDRIGVFEGAIGQLEPILGPEIASLQREVLGQDLKPEEQEKLAHDAVLKIEQEKLDLERLDDQQAELMGQGDLLRKEAEDARETGRYISAVEVQAIVQRWLSDGESKRDRLAPVKDRPHIFDLGLSKPKLDQISAWMQDQRTQPTAAATDQAPVIERLREEGHAYVTFDSEVARENPRLPFIHSGHEVAATAIARLSKEGTANCISRVGRFPLPTWLPPEARDGVVLAIYRMRLRGLETQTTMLPIAVGAATGAILGGLSEQLLGTLSRGDRTSGTWDINEDTVRLAADEAFAEASRRRYEIESLARQQQESRIAIQTTTLTRSYRSRIRRSLDLAITVTNERIRHLHERRAEILEGELQDRLAQLQSAPEPSAAFELIALAAFVPDAT